MKSKHLMSAALAAALLTVAGASAQAANNNKPAPALVNFDGPYIGLQGGYESLKFDTRISSTSLGVSGDSDLGGSGWNGGAFAGYGVKVDNVYLGGEIEGGYSNADFKESDTDGVSTDTYKIREKFTYGASIRPGVFINDNTMLYGRVGIVRTKFDVGGNVLEGDDTLTGWRFGGGVETAVAQNVSLRADWTYTDYKTSSTNDGAGNSLSIDPSSNLFRVGVAYNF